ncbi:CD177 antigen isoform X4 [Manis pentadactyla]|uniref:CD177 antigen isoform X4 n=1 Tax=Manis pentadactyla TaxID=143292 RepID=UPI00255CECE1|nr:CD177 antigen isoform X4 [Manis pentadactyla]
MSPALLALLGAVLMWPGVQALICQWGTFEALEYTSRMPLQWTAGERVCEGDEGCQDTLVLIENGPLVYIVLTKGCTQATDHEARITKHNPGPGVSVISYTRVCRQDACNDLPTTLPLWDLPSPTVPASMRCPVCLSPASCRSTREETCPAGTTHCYSGELVFIGGGIGTSVSIQGCVPQEGCNLFKGTQHIGPLVMIENCIPRGHTSLILGSKGCSLDWTEPAPTISIHSGPPGVLIASYAQFCSSDGCNRANSTSVLLNSLPHPAVPAPGDLQCPACVEVSGTCAENSKNITCPKGTTQCYSGYIRLSGGGASYTVNVQGCMTQPSGSLLNHTWDIGVFSVYESSDGNETLPQARAAPPLYLAWAVGLGLFLALWYGEPSVLTLFPDDS